MIPYIYTLKGIYALISMHLVIYPLSSLISLVEAPKG